MERRSLISDSLACLNIRSCPFDMTSEGHIYNTSFSLFFMKHFLRGILSTIDLLINAACLVKKLIMFLYQ
jgi:hypothetical protein